MHHIIPLFFPPLKLQQSKATERAPIGASNTLGLRRAPDVVRALIPAQHIYAREIQLLIGTQRAPSDLGRLIVQDRSDALQPVLHVREECASAAASELGPEGDGDTRALALGEVSGGGGGLGADPVRCVGVGLEGEAAAGDGHGVGGDGA